MSSLPEKFYSTVLGGVSPVPLAPVQGLCLNSFFFLFPCLIPPSNQEDILIGTAEQQQYHGATNFSTAEAFKKQKAPEGNKNISKVEREFCKRMVTADSHSCDT